MADPFLFEKDGVLHIFAEWYDPEIGHGKIAHCSFDGISFSPWESVIDEGSHMSYPNIFEKNGQICMLPENCAAGRIPFFRAVHFPSSWVFVKNIIIGDYMVDTTLLPQGGLLSYSVEPGKYGLVLLKDGIVEDVRADDDEQLRPGGAVFSSGGMLYRPAQDCSRIYGGALNIYRLEPTEGKLPEEALVKHVGPDNLIISDLRNDMAHRLVGVHTYNLCENYEVIDVMISEISAYTVMKKVITKMKRR